MRVVLDCGNYRQKRVQSLEKLAQKYARNVKKTGRSTTLDPMNPYERRIIHATISEIDGVSSSSVGQEPHRCVMISSTSPRQGGGSNNGGGGYRPRRSNDRPSNGNGRPPRREKPQPYQESSKREIAPEEAVDQPLYGKVEI